MFFIKLYLVHGKMNLNTAYTYQVTENQYKQIKYGALVSIVFNNKSTLGIVVSKTDETIPEFKTNFIEGIVDNDFLDDSSKEVVKYLKLNSYFTTNQILKFYTPVNEYVLMEKVLKKGIESDVTGVKQRRIFNSLSNIEYLSYSELRKDAKVTTEDIKKAIDNGIIYEEEVYKNQNKSINLDNKFNTILNKYSIDEGNFNLFKVNSNTDYKNIINNYNKVIVIVQNVYLYSSSDNIMLSKEQDLNTYEYNRMLLKSNQDKYTVYITPDQLFNNFNYPELILILDENIFINKDQYLYLQAIEAYNTTTLFLATQPSLYNHLKFDKLKINYKDYSTDLYTTNYILCDELLKDNLFTIDQLLKIDQYFNEQKNVVIHNTNNSLANTIYCDNCGHVEKCQNCNIPFSVKNNRLHCKYCGNNSNIINNCRVCSSTLEIKNYGIKKMYGYLQQRYDNVILITEDNKSSQVAKLVAKINSPYVLLIDDNLQYVINYLNIDYLLLTSFNSSYYDNSLISIELFYNLFSKVNEDTLVEVQLSDTEHFHTCYSSFSQDQLYKRRILKLPPYYNIMSIELLSNDLNNIIDQIHNCESLFNRYGLSIKYFKPLINEFGNMKRRVIIIKYRKENFKSDLLNFQKYASKNNVNTIIKDKNLNKIYT